MDVNRNYPTTPTSDEFKPPIFTPRERSTSSTDSHTNIYAINLTHIPEVHTPITDFSFQEQVRLERDIAHQTSVITRDSFRTTYSSLQTMLSQMQLKVASAFLQETEYLQQREQRIEYEEQIITERQKQLEYIRYERQRLEENFLLMKERFESTASHVTKFKTDGIVMLQNLFSESRQIDEQLSDLISESMASLVRSRTIIQSKTNEFLHKSDDIRSELYDRMTLIHQTESAITIMLELIHSLNQLNNEHTQDLSIVKTDFDRKYQEYTDLSQTVKHDWDIKKELEQIRLLENEKNQAQKDLLDQTVLLENLKSILGKAVIP